MSAIRLVISDIDGTLVRHDKSLADATVAAAHRLSDAGIAMSLISARGPQGMYWIAERIGLPGPFGAFNGGTVFDADGTVREAHRIPCDLVVPLLDLFEDAGVTRWLFADDQWLATNDTDPHTDRERKSANLEPVLGEPLAHRAGRTDKIVAVSDDHALLKRLEDQAKAIAGDRATVVRSQPYYLDITATAANKGDGIAALARAYDVPLDAVAVFGDQANDVAMFRRAGLSVAMGQADDEVKAEADEVARTNDDDGVVDAIDRFVLDRADVA